ALLYNHTHILTAAHVINQAKVNPVKFELVRDGRDVDISIPVPANTATQTYQFVPAGFVNATQGKDIGVVLLTDPTRPNGGRRLVAPFGAQRYQLYTDTDEIGKDVTIVGYGYTGNGTTGRRLDPITQKRYGKNRIDTDAAALRNEVQTIKITGNPTGGNFILK